MTRYEHTIVFDAPQGVDPAVLAQIGVLAIQEAAAIAAKNWGQALAVGFQMAGLIASLFTPTPTPAPVPSPVPTPDPTPVPPAH